MIKFFRKARAEPADFDARISMMFGVRPCETKKGHELRDTPR